MAPAWKQILLTVKMQSGEIIDREHLRQIFMKQSPDHSLHLNWKEELRKIFGGAEAIIGKHADIARKVEYI
jgi:hypothetical protein